MSFHWTCLLCMMHHSWKKLCSVCHFAAKLICQVGWGEAGEAGVVCVVLVYGGATGVQAYTWSHDLSLSGQVMMGSIKDMCLCLPSPPLHNSGQHVKIGIHFYIVGDRRSYNYYISIIYTSNFLFKLFFFKTNLCTD